MKSLTVSLIGREHTLDHSLQINVISRHMKDVEFLHLLEYGEGEWKIRHGGKTFGSLERISSITFDRDGDDCPIMYVKYTNETFFDSFPVGLYHEPEAKAGYIRIERGVMGHLLVLVSSKLFGSATGLKEIQFAVDESR